MKQQPKEIGLGLLGLGTVGSSVYRLLQENAHSLTQTLGVPFVFKKIAVKNLKRNRPGLNIDSSLLTDKVAEVAHHPEVDIMVEVMGGTKEARYGVLEALEHGKCVVSANKALIAQHGKELFRLAQEKQKDFLFEAAVGGGIPILRVIRESLMGNEIQSVQGIVNGTSNYILSEMTTAFEHGRTACSFEFFLKDSQAKGYAEADPTMDIDGTDAVQKLAILASLAFGGWVDYRNIPKEGISHLDMVDIELADSFGFRIKLLAIAKMGEKGIDIRVHPTLLPRKKLLATVDGVFNALFLEGDPIGPQLLIGKGAGGGPTASVVVSDLVDIGRNRVASSSARVPILPLAETPIKDLVLADIEQLVSRYYCRLSVVDRPGTMAAITQILGENNISIASLVQKERSNLTPVPVVFLTHEAKEKNMRNAVKAIDQIDVVIDHPVVLRIEE